MEVSGLPDKLHDKLFDLIGDKTKYQRIGQRKRKRGENGDIPDDLNFMSKYCEIEGGPVDEQFRYIKTFEYFFIPEFLPFLKENISLDCTFKPVKNISGVYQVLILSIQFFNFEHDKTHCQPLLACLLPDKKQSTYDTAFREIKDFFLEKTGTVLAPEKIHTDNEAALISSIKSQFPNSILLTCHFHIVSNWRKYLNEHGLKKLVPILKKI